LDKVMHEMDSGMGVTYKDFKEWWDGVVNEPAPLENGVNDKYYHLSALLEGHPKPRRSTEPLLSVETPRPQLQLEPEPEPELHSVGEPAASKPSRSKGYWATVLAGARNINGIREESDIELGRIADAKASERGAAKASTIAKAAAEAAVQQPPCASLPTGEVDQQLVAKEHSAMTTLQQATEFRQRAEAEVAAQVSARLQSIMDTIWSIVGAHKAGSNWEAKDLDKHARTADFSELQRAGWAIASSQRNPTAAIEHLAGLTSNAQISLPCQPTMPAAGMHEAREGMQWQTIERTQQCNVYVRWKNQTQAQRLAATLGNVLSSWTVRTLKETLYERTAACGDPDMQRLYFGVVLLKETDTEGKPLCLGYYQIEPYSDMNLTLVRNKPQMEVSEGMPPTSAKQALEPEPELEMAFSPSVSGGSMPGTPSGDAEEESEKSPGSLERVANLLVSECANLEAAQQLYRRAIKLRTQMLLDGSHSLSLHLEKLLIWRSCLKLAEVLAQQCTLNGEYKMVNELNRETIVARTEPARLFEMAVTGLSQLSGEMSSAPRIGGHLNNTVVIDKPRPCSPTSRGHALRQSLHLPVAAMQQPPNVALEVIDAKFSWACFLYGNSLAPIVDVDHRSRAKAMRIFAECASSYGQLLVRETPPP
jgi:hypothetical protein